MKRTIRNALLFLAFNVHLSSGGSHVLKYFHTGVTHVNNLPAYTSVGVLDEEQFVYYDSTISKRIPKTEWMEKSESADYWDSETQILQSHEEWFLENIQTLMKRFNQTDGIHTWQWMYGCELHDDGTTTGYMQYGYDGEDFISLDLNTLTWTAPNRVAYITKQKMEYSRFLAEYQKNYVEHTCIEYLKQYMTFGRSSLNRIDPPEVTLFQDSSSLVCHATGFFPRGLMISWMKNREDLHENVELRESLPNQDGTFQKRSILTVSPEELNKNEYTCVVQHSGLEKDLVLRVPHHKVPSKGGGSVGVIIGAVIAVVMAVLLLALIGCVGFFIWRKKTSDFKPVACSDGHPVKATS